MYGTGDDCVRSSVPRQRTAPSCLTPWKRRWRSTDSSTDRRATPSVPRGSRDRRGRGGSTPAPAKTKRARVYGVLVFFCLSVCVWVQGWVQGGVQGWCRDLTNAWFVLSLLYNFFVFSCCRCECLFLYEGVVLRVRRVVCTPPLLPQRQFFLCLRLFKLG